MSSRPLLLGHRGARPGSGLVLRKPGLPEENTLAAFEYALAHGCDGFEFDVRATSDGRTILCHDPKLRRKMVADTPYDELCRECREDLPCMEDVLKRFGPRAYLDIELKETGYEESVVAALEADPPACGYVVTSFLPEVLRKVHRLAPSIPLGYICDQQALLDLWRDLPLSVVVPHHSLLKPSLLTESHQASMRVFTWTVNRESEMRRVRELGVDGIISDDPELLSGVIADSC